MKKLFLLPALTLIVCLLHVYGQEHGLPLATLDMIHAAQRTDTVEFDQEEALATLREELRGREDRPAGEVYENVQTLKQVPADRFLRIMEMGFSRSLGVNCTHCHNPRDFASEEKPQKQIARDMMAMVARINNELLESIENLESENPTVNCTTCHRGVVKPALNLDNIP